MADEEGVDLSTVSILDIANIDASDIAEIRAVGLEAGIYIFEVVKEDREQETVEDENNEDVPQFIQIMRLKILEVVAMPKPIMLPGVVAPNPADQIGKEFNHKIKKNISMGEHREADIAKFIGMVKAFAVDIGGSGAGSLAQIGASCVGVKFKGTIRLTKNRRDKDADPWPNLDTRKLQKLPK